jgi:cytochrome c peroxidase
MRHVDALAPVGRRAVASSTIVVAVALLGLGAATGCEGEPLTPPSVTLSGLVVPKGFPQPPIPNDNLATPEKVTLGRFLFYDTRLSGNGQQACGTCHLQRLAFTDGLTTAVGSTGEAHPRNTQSLTNVAYNATLTWANPLLTNLEQQLLIPIFGEHPVELGATGQEDEILDRLRADARYPSLYAAAFPDDPDPITWDNTVRALASFSRALISGDSPFDRFVYQGDAAALDASARRGLELFFSERLECHHCHGGFNLSEATTHDGSPFDAARFHNTGLYNVDGQGGFPPSDTGLFEVTNDPRDMGKFRPPSLRNVAVTAPYMHDGSVATLEDVIRLYEAGGRVIEGGPNAGDGRASPLKSGLVPGFTLTDAERQDLLRFLESLTDTTFLTDPRLSDPFAAQTP